ncbi:MAG: peptidyl-tRNA hydrolase [Bdellovibrionales bacterium]|nr:peptidyl-tRNA hydrolase [Bdellovibrionales bacterium]
MAYYRIEIQDLMIAHDEIDLDFGALRFQTHRGHGGHNGIRSIDQTLATNEYKRIRLGVGRPPHERMEIADYVLQNFNASEMNLLPAFLNLICEGVECSIRDGFEKAASRYNR